MGRVEGRVLGDVNSELREDCPFGRQKAIPKIGPLGFVTCLLWTTPTCDLHTVPHASSDHRVGGDVTPRLDLYMTCEITKLPMIAT